MKKEFRFDYNLILGGTNSIFVKADTKEEAITDFKAVEGRENLQENVDFKVTEIKKIGIIGRTSFNSMLGLGYSDEQRFKMK